VTHFEINIEGIDSPTDVLGIFEQIQGQAWDRIEQHREHTLEQLIQQSDEVIHEYADAFDIEPEAIISERNQRQTAQRKRESAQFEEMMRNNGFD
jgi:predicted GIY-YIG superfamily endonuclease